MLWPRWMGPFGEAGVAWKVHGDLSRAVVDDDTELRLLGTSLRPGGLRVLEAVRASAETGADLR